MPASRLTEAHRLAQARLGAQTVDLLLRTFPLLDLDDLDRSFPGWLRVVSQLVQRQRDRSIALSSNYLIAHRREILGAGFSPVIASPIAVDVLATSLLVTGPAALRSRLSRGMDRNRAIDMTRAGSAAAGMRHALNGGRETILETVRADDSARGWERVTSAKACDFCSLLSGRGHVYSEASADFAAHDSCVPGNTLVTGPSVEVGYRRWYEGEFVVVGLSDGQELSITPNHPVLTDRGWVEAGLLSEGEHVVRRSGADLKGLAVPHENEVPTPIKDVWGAVSMDRLRSVPVAAEDFHGDGVGSQGNVDVVAPNGLLSYVWDVPAGQDRAEPIGAWTGAPAVADSFAGGGGLASLLLGSLRTSDGCVCGGSVRRAFFRGQSSHSQSLRRSTVSPRDVRFSEPSTDDTARHAVLVRDRQFGHSREVVLDGLGIGLDRVPGTFPPRRTRFDPPTDQSQAQRLRVHAELGRQLAERLSGGISLSRVSHLRRVEYSGHVYNLQTAEGWYDANSIVVSNCMCSAVPVYGEARAVRDFTPSRRVLTQEQRSVRNERVRDFIANN